MKPSSPDLAVVWAQKPTPGWRDRPLLTATMQPRPRWIMPGTTALQVRNTPVRLTFITRCQRSSLTSSSAPMSVMPTLLCSTSIVPNSASAQATALSMSPARVTSPASGVTSPASGVTSP